MGDITTRISHVWIQPSKGRKPSWGAKTFPKADRSGRFLTLASLFDADEDTLPFRAEAHVVGPTITAGQNVNMCRHLYLVPACGAVEANGTRVNAREGAAITNVTDIEIIGIEDAEIVLVDAG